MKTFAIPPAWRQVLRQNFTQLKALIHFLHLNEAQAQQLLTRPRFALNLPLRLAAKIEKGSLNDPLLKQFVPRLEENFSHPDYTLDPVSDCSFLKEAKLLHKYEGRVLLVCTSACAMHCRYCFRQNFAYETHTKSFVAEIQAIAEDASIHEVILSGGDPLSLSNETLTGLVEALDAIPHIRRIRFHTRFPIGIPERIDGDFLALIEKAKKQIWFVIHSNHAREFDETIFSALRQLKIRGCVLLNQTVLLKEVNDNFPTLKALCELLVDQGILPYYLHQLDRVQGAAHFEVPEQEGRLLIQQLAQSLPGYAVPKYVREIAGQPYKSPL